MNDSQEILARIRELLGIAEKTIRCLDACNSSKWFWLELLPSISNFWNCCYLALSDYMLLQERVSTGFFHMRSTCRKCAGQGHIIKDPCKKCNGSGLMMETKTVTVPVPAGTLVIYLVCKLVNLEMYSLWELLKYIILREKSVYHEKVSFWGYFLTSMYVCVGMSLLLFCYFRPIL